MHVPARGEVVWIDLTPHAGRQCPEGALKRILDIAHAILRGE